MKNPLEKPNKTEKPLYICVCSQRIFGEIVTCDVTSTSVLAFFSSVRSPLTSSSLGLFDYDFNDRTRNNGKKLIVKRFNISVAHHFFPINITTTWNALPYDAVNSRTVNTFKNHLDAHWEDNPPDVLVNW